MTGPNEGLDCLISDAAIRLRPSVLSRRLPALALGVLCGSPTGSPGRACVAGTVLTMMLFLAVAVARSSSPQPVQPARTKQPTPSPVPAPRTTPGSDHRSWLIQPIEREKLASRGCPSVQVKCDLRKPHSPCTAGYSSVTTGSERLVQRWIRAQRSSEASTQSGPSARQASTPRTESQWAQGYREPLNATERCRRIAAATVKSVMAMNWPRRYASVALFSSRSRRIRGYPNTVVAGKFTAGLSRGWPVAGFVRREGESSPRPRGPLRHRSRGR